jgi:hypothetical protein
MAVRTPIHWDGNDLKELTTAQMLILKSQVSYAYSLNPAVDLTVVASAGSLDAMVDRRMQAGVASSDATNFDTEAETDDISAINTTYDKIDETVTATADPGDTNNRAYPLYFDSGTNTIQAMSQTDFYDTFIDPAIDNLVASYSDSEQAGTYYISSNSSETGMTLVSATPVFIDTRADADLYTASGIAETQDQPETITSYYLHKIDGASADGSSSFKYPLYANADGSIQEYSLAELNTLFQNSVLYHTSSVVGDRISYSINGTGTNRGSAVDTYLSGSSADGYNTLQVGDDYRSQEFPNGTVATLNTYFLKITRS